MLKLSGSGQAPGDAPRRGAGSPKMVRRQGCIDMAQDKGRGQNAQCAKVSFTGQEGPGLQPVKVQ